jgi:hypothetical protein
MALLLFSNSSSHGNATLMPAPIADMFTIQPWAPLFRLPPEILYMICRETLCDEERTLTSLARTCRVLHQVAVLVLYAEIADRPPPPDDRGPAMGWDQVLRLHRTLFTTPSLARLVRSLNFGYDRLATLSLSSANLKRLPTYVTALQQRFGLDTRQQRCHQVKSSQVRGQT